MVTQTYHVYCYEPYIMQWLTIWLPLFQMKSMFEEMDAQIASEKNRIDRQVGIVHAMFTDILSVPKSNL